MEGCYLYEIFGVSLDPDEGADSIKMKIQLALSGYKVVEPYDAVVEALRSWVRERDVTFKGKVEVESWLSPNPTIDDLILLTPEGIVAFLDSNGCLEYRGRVSDFVRNNISDRPVMIGVDHSMTGGVLDALAERYGPSELGVIVFDSHFDAISSDVRNKLVEYARERSPNVEQFGFRPTDYVYYPEGRRDAYLCGSFLKFLVEEGVVKPENLVVYGPLDYPDARVREIADGRVREYVRAYLSLERAGVNIIPRGVIDRIGPVEAFEKMLSKLRASKVYVSIDVDILARRPILGAKFIDVEGISEADLYCLLSTIRSWVSRELVGFDVVEVEPLRAGGALSDGKQDLTYTVINNIFRIMLANEVALPREDVALLNEIKAYGRASESLGRRVEELMARGFVSKAGKHFKLHQKLSLLKIGVEER